MAEPERRSFFRDAVARGYTVVEDIVYIGLGLLLAALVIGLLVFATIDFVRSVPELSSDRQVIGILDRILLILLIVEVLYTVKVSFHEHALTAEPFILIGIISVIRRVLLLTAEIGELTQKGEDITELYIWELGVLALLIVALSSGMLLLRRSGASTVVDETKGPSPE